MATGFQKKLQEHWLIVAAALILLLTSPGCNEQEVETKEVIRPVKILTVGSEGDTSGRKFPGNVRAQGLMHQFRKLSALLKCSQKHAVGELGRILKERTPP